MVIMKMLPSIHSWPFFIVPMFLVLALAAMEMGMLCRVRDWHLYLQMDRLASQADEDKGNEKMLPLTGMGGQGMRGKSSSQCWLPHWMYVLPSCYCSHCQDCVTIAVFYQLWCTCFIHQVEYVHVV